MQEIKLSATGMGVLCGPFLDKTDGITPEVGIDLTTADSALIYKHGASASFAVTSATWTHVGSGFYALAATGSMFDTLGQCTLLVQDVSICLPYHKDLMVVATTYWNWKYGTTLLNVASVSNPGTICSVSGSFGAVTNITVASVSGSILGPVTIASISGSIIANYTGAIAGTISASFVSNFTPTTISASWRGPFYPTTISGTGLAITGLTIASISGSWTGNFYPATASLAQGQ